MSPERRPSLEADLDAEALEAILSQLLIMRFTAELTHAAKQSKLRGPKTDARISRQSSSRAKHELDRIKYNATDSDTYGTIDQALPWLLTRGIEHELLNRYDRGIFSLSERFLSPLMWSHYGDQHRGLCIGYSVPEDAYSDLHKVDYTGGRLVKASDVAKMLAGDDLAKDAVDAGVLRRKAPDWRYEREWRLVGPRGLQRSPLELETITFGMRCSSAVQHAVVSALYNRDRPVRFYEMHEVTGSFQLRRKKLDLDELKAFHPLRSRTALEAFSDIYGKIPNAPASVPPTPQTLPTP